MHAIEPQQGTIRSMREEVQKPCGNEATNLPAPGLDANNSVIVECSAAGPEAFEHERRMP